MEGLLQNGTQGGTWQVHAEHQCKDLETDNNSKQGFGDGDEPLRLDFMESLDFLWLSGLRPFPSSDMKNSEWNV